MSTMNSKHNRKKPRVHVSILDMMYCQPNALGLLPSTPGIGNVQKADFSSEISNIHHDVMIPFESTSRECGGSIGGSSGSSSSSDRSTSISSTRAGNMHAIILPSLETKPINSIFHNSEEVNCNNHQSSILSLPPPSASEADQKKSNIACPICDRKCKSLLQLNIHLDRNCKEDEENEEVGDDDHRSSTHHQAAAHHGGSTHNNKNHNNKRKKRKSSVNDIGKYFGLQQQQSSCGGHHK
jgi:hypothetical protein